MSVYVIYSVEECLKLEMNADSVKATANDLLNHIKEHKKIPMKFLKKSYLIEEIVKIMSQKYLIYKHIVNLFWNYNNCDDYDDSIICPVKNCDSIKKKLKTHYLIDGEWQIFGSKPPSLFPSYVRFIDHNGEIIVPEHFCTKIYTKNYYDFFIKNNKKYCGISCDCVSNRNKELKKRLLDLIYELMLTIGNIDDSDRIKNNLILDRTMFNMLNDMQHFYIKSELLNVIICDDIANIILNMCVRYGYDRDGYKYFIPTLELTELRIFFTV